MSAFGPRIWDCSRVLRRKSPDRGPGLQEFPIKSEGSSRRSDANARWRAWEGRPGSPTRAAPFWPRQSGRGLRHPLPGVQKQRIICSHRASHRRPSSGSARASSSLGSPADRTVFVAASYFRTKKSPLAWKKSGARHPVSFENWSSLKIYNPVDHPAS